MAGAADNAIDAEVRDLVAQHVTPEWLARWNVAIADSTRFEDLAFDAVDQAAIAARVEARFGAAVPDDRPWFESVGELTRFVRENAGDRSQDERLRGFFGGGWTSRIERYEYSGPPLAARVLERRPTRVLDVGCGDNPFKALIPNLVGLDIVNPRADVVCDLSAYDDPGPFDAILALGSVNFGSEADIMPMLVRLRELLAPDGRIYMRVNPGLRWAREPDLVIFPWDRGTIVELGRRAGLEVDGEILDDPGENGLRLFFVYRHAPRAGSAT